MSACFRLPVQGGQHSAVQPLRPGIGKARALAEAISQADEAALETALNKAEPSIEESMGAGPGLMHMWGGIPIEGSLHYRVKKGMCESGVGWFGAYGGVFLRG